MSDYTKTTNFTAKDALPSGTPAKAIKGSEHDTEYDNIATAVATKANKAVPSAANNIASLSAAGDLQDGQTHIIDLIYPVGSVYVSTVSTNPNTLFGRGTWVATGVGRVLVGVGTSDAAYALDDTGGSSDVSDVFPHTHTAGSLAANSGGAHTHSLNYGTESGAGYVGLAATLGGSLSTSSNGAHTHTISGTSASTGTAGAGDNMPPYLVVHMWERTA